MTVHRRAFTPIELLFVIAIIAVLIYEGSSGVLPFEQGGDSMSVVPGAPLHARWSAHSQLLGFMEPVPLFSAANYSLPPETPDVGSLGMAMGMNMLAADQDPNRGNSTVCRIAVGTFLCPSDVASPSSDWPGVNNDVVDGGNWLSDACERVTETTSIDQMDQSCSALSPSSGMAMVIASKTGGAWAVGDLTFSTYNHVGPPKSTSCSGMQGMMMPGKTAMVNTSFQAPPSSNHPGGVNVLFGDGSVRFLKQTVALNVWRALATRNGGEVIGGDAY